MTKKLVLFGTYEPAEGKIRLNIVVVFASVLPNLWAICVLSY